MFIGCFPWLARQLTVPRCCCSGYVLNLTSQQWLDTTKVDRSIWTHQLVVIVPNTLKYTTSAGLYITGGGNDNPSVPSTFDEDILVSAVLAVNNGIICATLFQVPNAPIVFADDPTVASQQPTPIVMCGSDSSVCQVAAGARFFACGLDCMFVLYEAPEY